MGRVCRSAAFWKQLVSPMCRGVMGLIVFVRFLNLVLLIHGSGAPRIIRAGVSGYDPLCCETPKDLECESTLKQ